jgi:hypothetical protein
MNRLLMPVLLYCSSLSLCMASDTKVPDEIRDSSPPKPTLTNSRLMTIKGAETAFSPDNFSGISAHPTRTQKRASTTLNIIKAEEPLKRSLEQLKNHAANKDHADNPEIGELTQQIARKKIEYQTVNNYWSNTFLVASRVEGRLEWLRGGKQPPNKGDAYQLPGFDEQIKLTQINPETLKQEIETLENKLRTLTLTQTNTQSTLNAPSSKLRHYLEDLWKKVIVPQNVKSLEDYNNDGYLFSFKKLDKRLYDTYGISTESFEIKPQVPNKSALGNFHNHILKSMVTPDLTMLPEDPKAFLATLVSNSQELITFLKYNQSLRRDTLLTALHNMNQTGTPFKLAQQTPADEDNLYTLLGLRENTQESPFFKNLLKQFVKEHDEFSETETKLPQYAHTYDDALQFVCAAIVHSKDPIAMTVGSPRLQLTLNKKSRGRSIDEQALLSMAASEMLVIDLNLHMLNLTKDRAERALAKLTADPQTINSGSFLILPRDHD